MTDAEKMAALLETLNDEVTDRIIEAADGDFINGMDWMGKFHMSGLVALAMTFRGREKEALAALQKDCITALAAMLAMSEDEETVQ